MTSFAEVVDWGSIRVSIHACKVLPPGRMPPKGENIMLQNQ